MLILCNYDTCYHSFYEFSPLVYHFTKVHIYTLFRINYVLYGCVIFCKVKQIEINHFPSITLTLLDVLKNKFQEENVRMI